MPKTACFFIGFFLSFVSNAQQLPLETYTPAQGLVDARINKIFQDSKGRIFFLTREGFSIFDGQRFDNYGAANDFGTEIFNDITEDKKGNINIYSFSGNVYRVTGNTVTVDSSKKNILQETNKVFDIGNDEKLVLTNYFILKEKNNGYKKLAINIPSNNYHDIENAVRFGDYLIFSSSTDNNRFKIYLYNYQKEQLCDSIDNSRMLVTAANKEKVCFFSDKWHQFDTAALNNGKLKIVPFFLAQSVPEKFIVSYAQFDNENNLWLISREKGYCRINPFNKKSTFFTTGEGILSSANAIFEDQEKNYWFISSGRGVQKLQRSPLAKIDSIDHNKLEFVSGISSNENSEAYINASDGIFFANKKISNNRIADRYSFYWQGQYWQFTDYKTLVGSAGTVFHMEKLIGNFMPSDIQSSHTSIDKEGRLIIAGNTILLINKNYSLAWYKLPYFCDNVIADDNNTYWCFLRSNYAVRLELQNNIFLRTYYKLLYDLNPRYSIKWNNNTFMIGTRMSGIKILQWEHGDFKTLGVIDKKNGLSNNFVNVLLQKSSNRLLAGTGTGLDMLSFTAGDTIIENISARNTIFSSFNNLVPLKDSSVLCHTLDGQLFRLENADSLSSTFTPKVFIRDISVNSKQIDFAMQDHFTFSNNNFNFRISAPSFLDNRNMKFHFVLSGNGGQWEQQTASADFQTNNLLPGRYQLKVTVQYPGKFYPDQQLQYAFVITPPFWRTWWFILLTIASVTGLIFYLARRYYQRQLEKQKIVLEKELAIEQERTRMSRELHDGLGSMLSGIKHSFAAMRNQLELNDSESLKFHGNIDKLNESIKELRNISHSMASDSLLKYGLENSLSDYCRNISEPGLLAISFTALDIERIQLTEEQSFHIFRIVQELLQNVLKHADAKNAILQISYNAKRLYITVEDDGKGFEMNEIKHKKGLGLKNVETRVKILKGRIDHQSSSLKGTSVLIEIPCSGTK
jgi:signal transduction histidine kinase